MKLPGKSLFIFVALVLGVLAAGLGILSLPWVKPTATSARISVIARGSGPLFAGIGVVPIEVPLGAPIAGFPHLSYRSDGADPVTARALVLASGDVRVAVVEAEILLVPDTLRAAVLARIQDVALSGVMVTATHTHASPGGYYENLVAERAGLGPYDPRMRDAIANAMARAVRIAVTGTGPARLSVGRGRDVSLVSGRSDSPPDGRLTVLRLDRPDGEPIAELTVLAAHPTTLGIRNRRISGDWPGQFFALGGGRRGERLLLQGPVGDQGKALPRYMGPTTPQAYAAAVDRAVAALAFSPPDPMPALAFAAAEVTLPRPAPAIVPGPLRPAATNLASGMLPARAIVSALRVGPVTLLGTPAEVMARSAERWRALAGPGSEVLSLVDGYLGYVDGGEGDAREHPERSYYGAALAPALEAGLSLAVGALREAEKPLARPPRGDGAEPVEGAAQLGSP